LKDLLDIPHGYNFRNIPASRDIQSLLKEARLDYSKPIEAPPTILKVGQTPFGSLGGFSLITGKAKSKKTFLVTMMIAAALSRKLNNNPFQGYLPNDKLKVVLVDTEQAEHEVQKVADRVKRLSGFDISDLFDVYALRPFSSQQRLEMIDLIVNTTENLGFLVIDGARDIIQGINDDKSASEVVGKFLQWSAEKNIHITTVLHQNKADNNARGHIGTELVNKAETVISVRSQKADNNISIVKAEYTRDIDFADFAISINKEGLPELLNNYKSTKAGRKKTTPEDLSQDEHQKIIEKLKVKLEGSGFKYHTLVKELSTLLKELELPSGTNKAKEFAKYYESLDMLDREGKPRSPNAIIRLR